jgi:eukaryotic-like serine/threonine-protein kinase
MDNENLCWGCGERWPDDATKGLCPACLVRAGLEGSCKDNHELTVSFGPAFSSTFSRLAESLGGLPRVLLRDSDRSSDPGPIVRPASEQMPDLADQTTRLQLFGEIARGGMGIVLKGRDPDLGRDVAVKVLLDAHRDRPDLVRRFVEEAQIGGQLQHPGVVPIYELGAFADRRPFFAMKLVKGRTLASLLAERPDPARDLPRFLAAFE